MFFEDLLFFSQKCLSRTKTGYHIHAEGVHELESEYKLRIKHNFKPYQSLAEVHDFRVAEGLERHVNYGKDLPQRYTVRTEDKEKYTLQRLTAQ